MSQLIHHYNTRTGEYLRSTYAQISPADGRYLVPAGAILDEDGIIPDSCSRLDTGVGIRFVAPDGYALCLTATQVEGHQGINVGTWSDTLWAELRSLGATRSFVLIEDHRGKDVWHWDSRTKAEIRSLGPVHQDCTLDEPGPWDNAGTKTSDDGSTVRCWVFDRAACIAYLTNNIKAEAAKRIEVDLDMPIYKQLNATHFAIEKLYDQLISGATVTDSIKAELKQIRISGDLKDKIRLRSNELEKKLSTLSDEELRSFDATLDEYWQ